MKTRSLAPSVAVIGSGVAGAACAAGLRRAGLQVTLIEKSAGVGGRMATRRVSWTDANGRPHETAFDHGAQAFRAHHPRFRAVMAGVKAAGAAASWRPIVQAATPLPPAESGFVPVPDMPALCRHLVAGVPVRLEHTAQRLQRSGRRWRVACAGGELLGPFDQVMLALPPAQAAVLLAGHHDAWADALADTPMQPCWTLMAITDDCEWPWDAAVPERGPLAWVGRNDRKPGRVAPPGRATWVAQATPAWSSAHLDDDPGSVTTALRDALLAQLPSRPVPPVVHHALVHRWRHALPAAGMVEPLDAWWDAELGLGVCGDFLGAADVEGAWRSGDELADTVAAAIDVADLQPA